MLLKRSRALALVLGSAAAMRPAQLFASGRYPQRPITLVTWVNPGSPADLTARQIASYSMKYLGVPMVVENRTGGDGANTLAYLLSQPADGYTLLLVTRSIETTLTGDLKGKFTFEDLSYIATVNADPMVFAAYPGSAFRSVADIVNASKTAPVTMAGFGTNTAHAVFVKHFAAVTGAKINWVPFTGAAAAVAAVLGGHVPIVASQLDDLAEPIGSGQLRGLAVSSETLLPDLPGVPTFKAAGYKDLTFSQWRGIAARAGTPGPVIDRLAAFARNVVNDQDFQLGLRQQHLTPFYRPTNAFTKMLNEEVAALG